ncbi:hypothetical protein [Parasulfitobacter algicola]|uniref:Uncharacterized protein n=1 Tax=Parasulfitobacter algicola TaxID=2614809 RepID=A0ABX2IZY8_9RHOB|nr:hypothetical protein [Sulfitobacter algicola]NSX56391.1 hypothetical protein [Sulfitobacter algicola]
MLKNVGFLALLMCMPMMALAEQTCATQNATKCIVAYGNPSDGMIYHNGKAFKEPKYKDGDVIPVGKYSLLLNTQYYGLPRATDGWVYMQIDEHVYRVDWKTHTILSLATLETAAVY